jgi:hypothetical protein
VKITDQLVESREDRLTAADLGLPPIFWEVIAFLLVLLVGFAAFVEPQRGRAISLGGLGIGLALLINLGLHLRSALPWGHVGHAGANREGAAGHACKAGLSCSAH